MIIILNILIISIVCQIHNLIPIYNNIIVIVS